MNHIGIAGGRVADDLANGLAGDRGAIFMQPTGVLQFVHHGRHAAGAVETFTEVFAGGHAVDQQGHVFADALPVFQAEVDAGVPRDSDEVRRAIGRGTQC
ncbi:hypothetical protein D3C72_436810 [compost metagenome]